MSSTLLSVGFVPVGRNGNAPYQGGTNMYAITANNSVAIAKGDLVALVAGSIAPITATPVSGTLGANTPIGVVVGFNFVDPIGNRTFVNTPLLPANAVSSLGYTNIYAIVVDDLYATFRIQASGSITQANVGATIAVGNFGSTDLTRKVSRLYANQSTLNQTSGSTLALRILAIDRGEDNAAGDAFTQILVKWNKGVHALDFAGTQ